MKAGKDFRDVTEIEGAQTKEGRKATFTIEGKDLGDLVKKCYTKGVALRKAIDAGEKTEETLWDDDALIVTLADLFDLHFPAGTRFHYQR